MNALLEVLQQGQTWLDLLDRQIMDSGQLRELIAGDGLRDGLRSLASNRAIFEKATSTGSGYVAEIAALAKDESDNEAIFFELALREIRRYGLELGEFVEVV